LVATALDWVVLGQRLTPLQVAGGLIVLGSVVAAQMQSITPRGRRRQAARTPQPERS
jgi:probable blue pigment (indigoidine) exporter